MYLVVGEGGRVQQGAEEADKLTASNFWPETIKLEPGPGPTSLSEFSAVTWIGQIE